MQCGSKGSVCGPCFRYKPILASEIIADLLADRATCCHPFEVTGVDLCGQVNTAIRIRGRKPVKIYIAIFASKAVHLAI